MVFKTVEQRRGPIVVSMPCKKKSHKREDGIVLILSNLQIIFLLNSKTCIPPDLYFAQT